MKHVSASLFQEKMQLGCSFLKSLYNPSLQLIRSTPSSNVYYIASDNLLAEKALSSCDPTTSKAINQSICHLGEVVVRQADNLAAKANQAPGIVGAFNGLRAETPHRRHERRRIARQIEREPIGASLERARHRVRHGHHHQRHRSRREHQQR